MNPEEDIVVELLNELQDVARRIHTQARMEERERCAKVLDELAESWERSAPATAGAAIQAFRSGAASLRALPEVD